MIRLAYGKAEQSNAKLMKAKQSQAKLSKKSKAKLSKAPLPDIHTHTPADTHTQTIAPPTAHSQNIGKHSKTQQTLSVPRDSFATTCHRQVGKAQQMPSHTQNSSYTLYAVQSMLCNLC
jgi:hypothetical protein